MAGNLGQGQAQWPYGHSSALSSYDSFQEPDPDAVMGLYAGSCEGAVYQQ